MHSHRKPHPAHHVYSHLIEKARRDRALPPIASHSPTDPASELFYALIDRKTDEGKVIPADLSRLDELDADNIDMRNIAQDTALIVASRTGSLDLVGKLLRCGANPNLAGHFGLTALHHAIIRGHVLTVRLLLSHGADPLLTSTNTFYEHSRHYDRNLLVASLGKHDWNALHYAVYFNLQHIIPDIINALIVTHPRDYHEKITQLTTAKTNKGEGTLFHPYTPGYTAFEMGTEITTFEAEAHATLTAEACHVSFDSSARVDVAALRHQSVPLDRSLSDYITITITKALAEADEPARLRSIEKFASCSATIAPSTLERKSSIVFGETLSGLSPVNRFREVGSSNETIELSATNDSRS